MDRVPDQVLLRILSYLSVKNRLKLEIISKRFQYCLQQAGAWKFEKKLALDIDISASNDKFNGELITREKWYEILEKFFRSSATITGLKINVLAHLTQGGFLLKIFNLFWTYPQQIKLVDFEFVVAGKCSFLNPYANWCLISNRETLKSVHLYFRSPKPDDSCDSDAIAYFPALSQCLNLNTLSLNGPGIDSDLLEGLSTKNLPVRNFHLHRVKVPAASVAKLCNSFGTLYELQIVVDCANDFMKNLFGLLSCQVCQNLNALICYSLQPPGDHSMLQILTSLPAFCPNLSLFLGKENTKNWGKEEILNAVDAFLNGYKDRDELCKVNLRVKMDKEILASVASSLEEVGGTEVSKHDIGPTKCCLVVRGRASAKVFAI